MASRSRGELVGCEVLVFSYNVMSISLDRMAGNTTLLTDGDGSPFVSPVTLSRYERMSGSVPDAQEAVMPSRRFLSEVETAAKASPTVVKGIRMVQNLGGLSG